MPEKYKWPTITGLYQPIDYGNVTPFDTTAIRNTMQSMTDLVHALGVKTKEEEEVERSQQLEKDKKAALEKSSQIWSELGNSENVYDWYNAHQPDPQKQAEFAQQGAATAGYLSAIPLTAFSAGTMGWIPAITSTATGFGGAHLGQKAGEYIDSKTGWNTTPWLTFGGGLLGGIGGYKGLVKAGSAGLLKGSGQMYGKQFMGDVAADVFNKGMKQGNPYLSTYLWKDFLTQEMTDPDRAVHVSHNPMSGKTISTKATHSSGTKWVPGSAERSLVGDDNMIWLWEGEPYRNQWNDQTFISVPKSNNMVQTRQARAVGVPEIDLTNPSTKIITRNPITGGFERQIVVSGPEPITPVKTHYRFFERPSTYFKDATYAGTSGTYAGKEVPAWQLPKGQRNQPYVKGYRAMYPEDVVVNFEKEKRQIIDLFNSKEYRDRLIADGYTPEEVDNFVNQMVLRNGKFERTPAAISERVGFDGGTAGVDHILVRNYNPETALHEFGHITEYPRMWTDPKQPKITKLQFPYVHNYYLEPGEIRTRALGVLQWMQETGKTIDDFYALPNNYNFGSNKRAFEFFNTYPEVQGRNYLMHFRKQGGSIPKNNKL